MNGATNGATNSASTASNGDSPAVGSPQRLAEFSLSNKVVLVSGGARGLGLTQAEALLEAGATGEWKHVPLLGEGA
jgi:hypothetical protein